MIRSFFNSLKSNNKGISSIEMVLLILDNPFTSSTYILSY